MRLWIRACSPHCLSCKFLRSRISRHDALVEDVAQWLRQRRVHVRKEVTGIVPDTAHRIDLWVRTDGEIRWCDLTVSDPALPSYVAAAAVKRGCVAELAESRKVSKWKKLAPATVLIQPLALEATGLVGPAMKQFLSVMEKATSHALAKRRCSCNCRLPVFVLELRWCGRRRVV